MRRRWKICIHLCNTVQVLANLQTLEVEVEVDGSLHDLLQVPLLNLGATEEDKFDGIQLLLGWQRSLNTAMAASHWGHFLGFLTLDIGLVFPTHFGATSPSYVVLNALVASCRAG